MVNKQITREMVDFHINTIENEEYWLGVYLIENGLELELNKDYKVNILKGGKVVSSVPLYMFDKLDHREVIQVIEDNKGGRVMTLLEKVCEELGVTLGEEWIGNDGFGYIIKHDGDITIRDTDDRYYKVVSGEVYERLIKGKLRPVWKPKMDDVYYTIKLNVDSIVVAEKWGNTSYDNRLIERGLVFKTKEEAIKATKKMLGALKEVE